jgi:subtilase family serine protease
VQLLDDERVRDVYESEPSGRDFVPARQLGLGGRISLDLDMISALCPDCNIVLVEASSTSTTNLADAVNEAKTFAPVAITNSYGGSETGSETTYNSVYTASANTAVTVAAGDDGYGVEFPAAAPGVTAVGGTSLAFSGTAASPAWSQTVWSGSGSGCSADEPMPSWQEATAYSNPGVCQGRQVADVSADADPDTGVAVYDTYDESGWLVSAAPASPRRSSVVFTPSPPPPVASSRPPSTCTRTAPGAPGPRLASCQ